MKSYELIIVLSGKVTAAKVKSKTASISKIIEINKGKVTKVNNWGEIDLAYEIEKNKSGVFLEFIIELKPETVNVLNDKLRMDEEVIRFLVVERKK